MVLIIVGALLILDNFDIDIFDYFWPALIIAAGVYLLYRGARKPGTPSALNDASFLGDSVHADFRGEVDGANFSHFIGDTELNLTGAQLKPGINNLTVSHFIGDIDILVPEGMAVEARCSGAFGDVYLLDRKEGGIFISASKKTADYDAADRKLRIECSVFIGDIRIRTVSKSSPPANPA